MITAVVGFAGIAFGYLLGRRHDARDVHAAPVDFERAIERLTTDETRDTHLKMFHVRPGERITVTPPVDILHHPKVKRAAPKKRKARK